MAIIRLFLTVATALLLAPFTSEADELSDVPGWVISGSAAEKYLELIDRSVANSGSPSAGLAAQMDAKGHEFGTLMQFVDARSRIGERIRLSA